MEPQLTHCLLSNRSGVRVPPGRPPLLSNFRRGVQFLSAAALLFAAGCGGSDDYLPIASARAHTATEKSAGPSSVTVSHLHGILRPDSNGRWYVQNTDSHWPVGLSLGVQHCPADPDCTPADNARGPFVRIFFDRNYTDAGSIIVTSDDDFGPRGIEGFSNLGTNSATIKITVNKQLIDPRTILSYAPAGAGNFFVVIAMVDRL